MQDQRKFIELIQKIVFQSNEIKKTITEENAPVNYACIFCQNNTEYEEFLSLAEEIGNIIQNTPTWPLYKICIDTVAWPLSLVKVRKPDPTRIERWDADFTLSGYHTFKEIKLWTPWYSLIEREKFEMIEYKKDWENVLLYFSSPSLTQQLGI